MPEIPAPTTITSTCSLDMEGQLRCTGREVISLVRPGDRRNPQGEAATLLRMAVRRIMPYYESPDLDATRAFYTRVLGLEEGTFGGGYIGFGSGQAQVVFAPLRRGASPARHGRGRRFARGRRCGTR